MGYENQINERGERLIWLEPNVVDRLRAMRGPGESYSDVILRLVADAGERRMRPLAWLAGVAALVQSSGALGAETLDVLDVAGHHHLLVARRLREP